jgi:hypothetical protein
MRQVLGGWARPGSWALVQNSYLQLVETLEQALSSWFEDDDGAVAGLHGEHCKLIRDLAASTPRPSPLINDEAARQVSVLERRPRGSDRGLGTNVLMRYQRLDEIVWVEVLGASPVRIILPIWVMAGPTCGWRGLTW